MRRAAFGRPFSFIRLHAVHPTSRMPVYEFRCQACSKKFSLLMGMTAEPDGEACPHCGSRDISRLVSRFARLRNEDARMDEVVDRLETMNDPDNPSEMRQMAREIGKAMDEDVSEELEEMFESDLETGDDE